MQPMMLPWKGRMPKIAADVFVAPGATLIGDVEIGPGSSVWFGCVLRGDVNLIRVGDGSNIQDGTVVHVDGRRYGTFIGDNVLIGHMALIHGCMIEDGAFIGMKACVMDGAVVERGAMVAAGALVTPGKVVTAGQLWAGTPAKAVRDLTAEETDDMLDSARRYAELAQKYRAELGGKTPVRGAPTRPASGPAADKGADTGPGPLFGDQAS